MSLSKPVVNTSNPSLATFEWAGKKGSFKAYVNETKEKVEGITEMSFIPLDQLGNVSGWNKQLGSCRSQETHSITSKPVKVFAWKDGASSLVKEGPYKEVKEWGATVGVKFHKIVYAMLTAPCVGLDAGSIIKLDLKGSSMSAWIEAKPSDGELVTLGEATEGESAMMSFMVPAFNKGVASDSQLAIAMDCDKELQAYFKALKDAVEVEEDVPEEDVSDESSSDIPF